MIWGPKRTEERTVGVWGPKRDIFIFRDWDVLFWDRLMCTCMKTVPLAATAHSAPALSLGPFWPLCSEDENGPRPSWQHSGPIHMDKIALSACTHRHLHTNKRPHTHTGIHTTRFSLSLSLSDKDQLTSTPSGEFWSVHSPISARGHLFLGCYRISTIAPPRVTAFCLSVCRNCW